MPGPIQYPLINGHRVSRTSTDLNVFGQRIIGWKSWTSGSELTPGEIHGNRVNIQGRTRGKAKRTLSIEFYREDYDKFVIPAAIALNPIAGYMENAGAIFLTVFEPTQAQLGNMTLSALGARIMKDSDGVSDNDDGLVVKVDFHVIDILRNGASAARDRPQV
jgi:hypothetical protein